MCNLFGSESAGTVSSERRRSVSDVFVLGWRTSVRVHERFVGLSYFAGHDLAVDARYP